MPGDAAGCVYEKKKIMGVKERRGPKQLLDKAEAIAVFSGGGQGAFALAERRTGSDQPAR